MGLGGLLAAGLGYLSSRKDRKAQEAAINQQNALTQQSIDIQKRQIVAQEKSIQNQAKIVDEIVAGSQQDRQRFERNFQPIEDKLARELINSDPEQFASAGIQGLASASNQALDQIRESFASRGLAGSPAEAAFEADVIRDQAVESNRIRIDARQDLQNQQLNFLGRGSNLNSQANQGFAQASASLGQQTAGLASIGSQAAGIPGQLNSTIQLRGQLAREKSEAVGGLIGLAFPDLFDSDRKQVL